MSSDLQNKMLNYEPEPPKGFWNRIEAALQEEALETPLTEKLLQYQQKPAAHVWDQISSQLDGTDKKVIPFPKRMGRYMAVAALFILAITGGIYLYNRDSSKGDDMNVSRAAPLHEQGNSTQPSSLAATDDDQPAVETLATKETGRKNAIAMNRQNPRKIRTTASMGMSPEAALPEYVDTRKSIEFTNIDDRYMVYSDRDGRAVRLPKKLFDAFSCIEEDLTCKQRIQGLQEKLATTVLTSDFTGILELINNLNDN
jgi:negative regulator of sigma E activity